MTLETEIREIEDLLDEAVLETDKQVRNRKGIEVHGRLEKAKSRVEMLQARMLKEIFRIGIEPNPREDA